jgi:hypothetical protein
MLALAELTWLPAAGGSLAILVAALLAIWVFRMIVRVLVKLIIVAIIVALVLSATHSSGRPTTRPRLRYVADISVFQDQPAGRVACRKEIRRRYLANPLITLLCLRLPCTSERGAIRPARGSDRSPAGPGSSR